VNIRLAAQSLLTRAEPPGFSSKCNQKISPAWPGHRDHNQVAAASTGAAQLAHAELINVVVVLFEVCSQTTSTFVQAAEFGGGLRVG